jgi:hypothetical protein
MEDAKTLMEVRNKVVHGQRDFSEKELTEYTRIAAMIYGYLQARFKDAKLSDMALWLTKPKPTVK